jgi:hypothetical protein
VSEDPSVKILGSMKTALAAAAQKVYDAWEQDAEGHDDEYGGGGICHDIAEDMAEVLNHAGVEAVTVSQSVGEVHVFVVAKFREGVYSIDIPPSLYERGHAYTWKKVAGVRFGAEDISVDLLDRNPERFEDYTEQVKMGFRDWLAENCDSFMVRRTWPALIASEMEPPSRRSSSISRRSRRR